MSGCLPVGLLWAGSGGCPSIPLTQAPWKCLTSVSTAGSGCDWVRHDGTVACGLGAGERELRGCATGRTLSAPVFPEGSACLTVPVGSLSSCKVESSLSSGAIQQLMLSHCTRPLGHPPALVYTSLGRLLTLNLNYSSHLGNRNHNTG